MAKAKDLICPLCHEVQFQVRSCKDAHIVCRKCCVSLLFTFDEDGSYSVSARPAESKKQAS